MVRCHIYYPTVGATMKGLFPLIPVFENLSQIDAQLNPKLEVSVVWGVGGGGTLRSVERGPIP